MARKPKISRGLADRQRLAKRLKRQVEAHWPRVRERRAERLAAVLGAGESVPEGDLELWLRVLDRDLDAAGDAEHHYNFGLAMLARRERERGRASADLSRQMKGLRQAVDMALGAGTASRLLVFDGRTRRHHDALAAQAAGVLARLRGLGPVEPIVRGVPADPEQWIEMIREPLATLDHARQQATLEAKRTDGLLLRKKKAFAGFDATARGLARMAVGQLQLVGETDLARRLRRFTRRRKRPGPKKKPASPR